MNTKIKHVGKSLVAIAILIVAILTVALISPNVAEGSEEIVGADLNLLSNNGVEDYSNLTNQVLPDKIDKNNIADYVPVDKFNKNGTTVYNGRNYGFIIYSNAKTNHVLLFKEEYTTHEDGDGYDVALKVVYENSFFKTGSTIMNANSPYHIAMSKVTLNNAIFDADVNNNIASGDYNYLNDSGAYYTQARYENKLSFFNKGAAESYAATVASCIITIGVSVIFPPAGVAAALGGVAATAVGMAPLFKDLNNNSMWLDTVNPDTAIDFPLSRQGQIEKYGSLRKNMQVKVKSDSEEYIGQSGDYTKTSFRIMNDHKKDYYVLNNISFELCRYSATEHHKVDEGSIESVYNVTGTDCTQYTQVKEQNESFELDYYQRISPLAKPNIFKFKPEVSGIYKMLTPIGYNLTVDNKVSETNIVKVDSVGCEIGILPNSESPNSKNIIHSRLLAEDFYNGEIAFTNIMIRRSQELNLNSVTKIEDLAIKVESSSYMNNDLYVVDAGDVADSIDMYITDGNLEVLAKAIKKDTSLYVNYPMKANKIYSVICVNRTGAPIDLEIEKKTGPTFDDYQNGMFSGIVGLYYSHETPYTQYYSVENIEIYNENVNIVDGIGGDYFLQRGYQYYLRPNSNVDVKLSLSSKTSKEYYKIDSIVECDGVLNEIFEFIPKIDALHTFKEGSYDIFDSTGKIYTSVNSAVLEADKVYRIIKRQVGGVFGISLNGEIIGMGNNTINSESDYQVYILNIDQRIRVDIAVDDSDVDRNEKFSVYDYGFNKIEFDHGYLLKTGKYYLIINNKDFKYIDITEYLQEVNIKLIVDGKVFNQNEDVKYYYGKYFSLPTPKKERYDFDGWMSGDRYVTDSLGSSYDELLADELILNASWTLRAIVMEINFDDKTTKWWNGEDIVDQNPGELYIEGDLIDQLINMKSRFIARDDGKKQGYFLSTFDYEKKSSRGNVDYYEFYPQWIIEKYFIEFIPPYNDIYATSRAVSYGENIDLSVFPQQAFALENRNLYWLEGWKLSGNSQKIEFELGTKLIDLTPGYGSEYNYDSDGDKINDSTLIRLSAEIHYVEYNVIINETIFNVGQDGYTVSNLAYYKYEESKYYGCNVLLSVDGRKFSFGGKINISDLTSYWQEGYKSVTVRLNTVYTALDVALSYYYAETDNIDIYNGSMGNVTLKDGYVRGYKFNYWTLDGNEIRVLNYHNLGIRQYYSDVNGVNLLKIIDYSISRTSLKPTSLITYRIEDEATIVDCSKYSTMVGMKFTIYPTAKEVTFVDGNCRDTEIIIEPRNGKLVINLDNITIAALNGFSAIDASECPELELYSYGSVTLKGGEASLQEGGAGIKCRNLSLLGEDFQINGGDSFSYKYNGRAGIFGVGNSADRLIIGAYKVTVTGGDGAGGDGEEPKEPSEYDQADQGKDGVDGAHGKNGTDGAVAIYYPGTVVINYESELICIGGDGGNGQNGGNGQKGGDGKDGKFLQYFAVKPGNGGSGGNGGNGGNGAVPMINGDFIKNGEYEGYLGEAGGCGFAGYKAPPGKESSTYNGNTTYYGSYGNDGKDGSVGKSGVSTTA